MASAPSLAPLAAGPVYCTGPPVVLLDSVPAATPDGADDADAEVVNVVDVTGTATVEVAVTEIVDALDLEEVVAEGDEEGVDDECSTLNTLLRYALTAALVLMVVGVPEGVTVGIGSFTEIVAVLESVEIDVEADTCNAEEEGEEEGDDEGDEEDDEPYTVVVVMPDEITDVSVVVDVGFGHAGRVTLVERPPAEMPMVVESVAEESLAREAPRNKIDESLNEGILKALVLIRWNDRRE